MHICHVTSAHKRYDDRIFIKECKSLHEMGEKVSLIVQDEMGDEVKDGIFIYSTGIKYTSRLKRLTLGSNNIFRLIQKVSADVYHIHDPELLLLCKRIKKLNKKIVFDSHENYTLQIAHKEYIPGIFRNTAAQLYKQIEKRLLKNVDAGIIPCTFNGKNPLAGKGRVTEYINGYPIMKVFYDRYDENVHRDRSICYVGGLSRIRGINNLVKAAGLAKVKLILVGEFSSVEYEKEILSMPEMEYVEYKGVLDWEVIYKIYQKTSIGMSTLLNDGQYGEMDNLPTKVYEYMSMGLPVIVSDSSYNRVAERENFGICVDPRNAGEIAQAISSIIDDSEKRKRMGTNGREIIRKKWNWEMESRKLINLYAKL